MSSEGDQGNVSHPEDASTDDVELDLSRAVRDLQLAAASLYEHEKEIEDLGIRYGRIRDATLPFTTAAVTNADESEDNAIRRISLIADTLRQERERDQEETVVLPSGIEARGRDAQSGGSREGERTMCELVDRTRSRRAGDDVHVPRVTNLLTVPVTMYTTLLLACLLALLVAIVVAAVRGRPTDH